MTLSLFTRMNNSVSMQKPNIWSYANELFSRYFYKNLHGPSRISPIHSFPVHAPCLKDKVATDFSLKIFVILYAIGESY